MDVTIIKKTLSHYFKVLRQSVDDFLLIEKCRIDDTTLSKTFENTQSKKSL